MMEEHVLSINDFNMPMTYKNHDAEYMLIVRLLLLDKGKFQSHPKMGVGLRTEFRFTSGDEALERLKLEIEHQIQTYLPQLILKNIMLSLSNGNILTIQIETSSGTYGLIYDGDTEQLTPGSYSLDDLN